MKFKFHAILVICVFIAYFVFDICCDIQVVQYSENKEIYPTHYNNVSLSTDRPKLDTKDPLKTIKSNTIVPRRRRRKRRRRKKIQNVSQSSTVISPLATKGTDLLISTLPTTKRPRRRRIKIRRKSLKRKQFIESKSTALNSTFPTTKATRKIKSSFKRPTLGLETKSLVLPVIPTPKLLFIKKNKSSNVKKIDKENTRCSKNNGGCAHVCLFKGTERCQCFKGFRLAEDKKNCIDINECSTNINSCQVNCTNTIGSYRCHCPRGLRLGIDLRSCEDVNECRLRNGHGPCQDTCQNTYGGYKCNCDGLKGTKLGNNQHSCVDVDECSKENGGCSHICINTFGKSFCSCPEGLELSLDFKSCLSKFRVRCGPYLIMQYPA